MNGKPDAKVLIAFFVSAVPLFETKLPGNRKGSCVNSWGLWFLKPLNRELPPAEAMLVSLAVCRHLLHLGPRVKYYPARALPSVSHFPTPMTPGDFGQIDSGHYYSL